MIKLIVFDMAGTVVNENNVVYKTVQKAINEAGIPVTLEQVLAEGAGKEKAKAIRDILALHAPGQPAEAEGKIYQRFVELLEIAYENLDVTPMEGAEKLFAELKQRSVYVVLNTGYNRATANQLIAKLRWAQGETFDHLVTASDVNATRPQPDMILHAMKLCGLTDSSQVLKIGDSIIDIEEGKNAGCGITVGITTGAHTRDQLESATPDYVIDGLSEVVKILDKNPVA
ncbi:MAG: phosphonatase-like hydrolase [Bacteroidetes bacterium]|nr:phosphonatase-like hydrolase [Bacteroidota bacterium]